MKIEVRNVRRSQIFKTRLGSSKVYFIDTTQYTVRCVVSIIRPWAAQQLVASRSFLPQIIKSF